MKYDKYQGSVDSEDPEMEGFDIVDRWRVNSSRYRVIFKVAHDVLAILVSTVASESSFSIRGYVFWTHFIINLLMFVGCCFMMVLTINNYVLFSTYHYFFGD